MSNLPAFLVLGFASHIVAAPPFFEPKDGFYQARGLRVKAAWSVDRTEVPADNTLTATLTIRGATNPREIVRPDLAKLPAFADRFQIENVPGPPLPPDAQEAVFVYHLRPRSVSVNRLPTLPFAYDTGRTTGDPFETTTAKGIDIVVTPAAKPKPPIVPLTEPDELFEIVTEPAALGGDPFVPGRGAWLLLAALGVLIAGAWFAVWRRLYPDAARLARLYRRRAVRQALAAIRRSRQAADPAAVIAEAVREYTRVRFALPPEAQTPNEVGNALRTAGLSKADTEAATRFLRRCDAARFAPAGDIEMSLAPEAATLVLRLEAAQ